MELSREYFDEQLKILNARIDGLPARTEVATLHDKLDELPTRTEFKVLEAKDRRNQNQAHRD